MPPASYCLADALLQPVPPLLAKQERVKASGPLHHQKKNSLAILLLQPQQRMRTAELAKQGVQRLQRLSPSDLSLKASPMSGASDLGQKLPNPLYPHGPHPGSSI